MNNQLSILKKYTSTRIRLHGRDTSIHMSRTTESPPSVPLSINHTHTHDGQTVPQSTPFALATSVQAYVFVLYFIVEIKTPVYATAL